MTRVVLPAHLRNLAGVKGEVEVDVDGQPTARAVIDALEARYPVLKGTIRDQQSGRRRAYVRYYGAGLDLSHDPDDNPLPAAVAAGDEPFIVLGAISGG